MYTPENFRVEDVGEAHALMRAHPFAILLTHGADGLMATHLPTVLKTDGSGNSGASSATWRAPTHSGARSPPTPTR